MNRPVRPSAARPVETPVVSEETRKTLEGEKRIVIDVPAPLHRALKQLALDRGISMKAVVLELLERHEGIRK